VPTVLELWRWPVKGMAGESVPSLRVDARGVGGDRTHAVLGEDGIPLGDLEGWRAAYPFNIGANVDPASPPLAQVISPRGRAFMWNDPRLLHALEDDLGRPVRLQREVHGLQLVERTVLVCWGEDDARQLRANLKLDAGDGLDEYGRVLECAGGVRLRMLGECERGGTYARVVGAGRIAAGVQVSGASGR
jgi:MOSC N-terminal beta barrel domain